MNGIEARGLHRLLQPGLYRRALRRASRRARARPDEAAEGITLVTSSERAAAERQLRTGRAVAKTLSGPSLVWVTPRTAWNAIDDVPPGWSFLVYGPENATRAGLPEPRLRRLLAETTRRHALLLTQTPEPFSEFLFALARSPWKAAFDADGRAELADLLVKPKPEAGEREALEYLIDTARRFLIAGG
ncbi:MAG: hypothetical protein MAG453_00208 [Calditrichaeota bacterium]|nr:hypothetical protein [Calditrichota bacterium]